MANIVILVTGLVCQSSGSFKVSGTCVADDGDAVVVPFESGTLSFDTATPTNIRDEVVSGAVAAWEADQELSLGPLDKVFIGGSIALLGRVLTF